MSVYVSIGRNIGSEQMSAEAWRDFRRDVVDAVEAYAAPLVSETDGVGWWEGKSEATAVIVGAGEYLDHGPLAARLEVLRKRYGQEAIAVAVAEPIFLGSGA